MWPSTCRLDDVSISLSNVSQTCFLQEAKGPAIFWIKMSILAVYLETSPVRSHQTRRGDKIPYKVNVETRIGRIFAREHRRQVWREFCVMTANQRSTAWPLSDMCNVTANQRSTVKLSAVQSGVNCSIEEKVIFAVCDSRSSTYNSI